MTQNNANKQTSQTPNELVLGGDVIYNTGRSTVVAIQNTAVSSATPADTNLLQYVGGTSKWTPGAAFLGTNNGIVGVKLISANTTGSDITYNVVSSDMAIVVVGHAVSNFINIHLQSGTTVGRVLIIGTANNNPSIGPSAPLYVYAPSGYTIDGTSSATAWSGFPSGGVILLCYDGNNWVSNVSA